MSKKPIHIQSDTASQFEVLTRSAFKDPYCNTEENIQNADRSGAKTVKVTNLNGSVTYENDGKVLEDPTILFVMGKSGWSDEVKKNEKPFGVGFFSNIPLSNYIEVFSANYHIVFDRREEMDIYYEKVEDYYDGFKLILHDYKKDSYRTSYEIEERVRLIGKISHNLDIYYNGELIEKRPLTEGQGNPFELSIDEDEQITGWIGLKKDYFSSGGLKIFYKGRYVKTMDWHDAVVGEIHLEDHVLNLQSPDRKDIVDDTNYDTFKYKLRSYISQLAELAVLQGSEEDIFNYQSTIEDYVNIESIRYRIPYSIFDGKAQDDMNYLSGIALALRRNDDIKTIGQMEVYLRKEAEKKEQEEELAFKIALTEEKAKEVLSPSTSSSEENETESEPSEDDVNETEEVDEASEEETEVETETPASSEPKEEVTSVEREEKKQSVPSQPQRPKRKTGSRVYLSEDNQEAIFWVRFEEVNQFKKRIELIQQYGIKLIVTQNRIEEKSLERSTSNYIYHIGHLEQQVTIRSYISNTALSLKEKRASMLLDMISRMYGFEHNVFHIGDVMVTKFIEVPSLSLEYEDIAEDATVVANKEEKRVYIDRTLIQDSMLSEHTNEEFEVSDYKFILLHLESFIEQVSLLGVNNKDELYKKTLLSLATA